MGHGFTIDKTHRMQPGFALCRAFDMGLGDQVLRERNNGRSVFKYGGGCVRFTGCRNGQKIKESGA